MINVQFAQQSNQTGNPQRTGPTQAVDSPARQLSPQETAQAQLEHIQNTSTAVSKQTQISSLLQLLRTYILEQSSKPERSKKAQLDQLQGLQKRSELISSLMRAQDKHTVNAATKELVKTIVADLTSPVEEIAHSAEVVLENLGLNRQEINRLKAAQKLNHSSERTVMFSGSASDAAIEAALNKILDKNSLSDIIDSAIEHQTNSIHAMLEPVFGASRDVMTASGRIISIPITANLPSGAQELY